MLLTYTLGYRLLYIIAKSAPRQIFLHLISIVSIVFNLHIYFTISPENS